MPNVIDRSNDSFTHAADPHSLDELSAVELLRPLSELSNDDLWRRLHSLTLQTRELTARQVAFLAEVERRRLWDELACTSLYDFCRRRLRMSDDGAYRRKTAAQLALRFPIILEKLQDGEVSLSALVMLRGYFTEANHVELIEAASDKTKREIENLIAERFPREDVPARMYEAKVLPGDRLPPPGLTSPAFSGGQAPPACNERTILEALSPGRHRIEFTGSAELRAKLEYGRDLMRHSNPKGDLAIIVERAMDLLIAKVERERFGKTAHPRKTSSSDPLDQIARGKHIPAHVRREVAERDGYQCTFESADGWRCPARSFLQFDHIIPRARGGEHSVANICLKCGLHNRSAAKKLFGRQYVEKKIAERQKNALLTKDGVEVSSLFAPKPRQSNPDAGSPKPNIEPAHAIRSETSSAAQTTCSAARVAHEPTTPNSPEGQAPDKPIDDTTKRPTFALVQGALVNLGFSKKDAIRALEEIDARIESTSPLATSLEGLLREALAVLT